jgi:tetratricopeptide (TPR) repeat protein
LRQWLFDFRRRCGGACPVRSEGELLQLDAQACETDLARFHELAQSDVPAQWPEAVGLLGGALAERLSATAEFDQWLAAQRESVRSAAHDLLLRMASMELGPTSLTAACQLARTLVAIDPLDEAAYRALMVLQDAAGQRAKAMETWIACRRALMAEVGAQPSAETVAVHQRIQCGAPAPGRRAPIPYLRLPAGATPPPPVSGSDEALAAAADYMERGASYCSNMACADDNWKARAAYQAAAELCPHDPEPRWMLSRTHLNDFVFGWHGNPAAHYRTACAQVAWLRRRFPGDPLARGMAGRLLLWRGEHQAALHELKQSLAQGETVWILGSLANALTYAGRDDEALAVARAGLQMQPNDRGFLRTIEGMAQFNMGDLEGALRTVGSALRRHPRHCVAWGTLAAVHAELGDIDAARAAVAAAKSDNARMSVDFARKVMPFTDPAVRDRWVKAWAVAGMPRSEGTLRRAEGEWITTRGFGGAASNALAPSP